MKIIIEKIYNQNNKNFKLNINSSNINNEYKNNEYNSFSNIFETSKNDLNENKNKKNREKWNIKYFRINLNLDIKIKNLDEGDKFILNICKKYKNLLNHENKFINTFKKLYTKNKIKIKEYHFYMLNLKIFVSLKLLMIFSNIVIK